MNNFFVYDYPPPEMNKGCEAFYEVKKQEKLNIILKSKFQGLARDFRERNHQKKE